jgi:hypothetical protein
MASNRERLLVVPPALLSAPPPAQTLQTNTGRHTNKTEKIFSFFIRTPLRNMEMWENTYWKL